MTNDAMKKNELIEERKERQKKEKVVKNSKILIRLIHFICILGLNVT